jgi:hypothetical protein
MQANTEDALRYIGMIGSIMLSGMEVHVKIMDINRMRVRTMVQIEPLHGSGRKWIEMYKLNTPRELAAPLVAYVPE